MENPATNQPAQEQSSSVDLKSYFIYCLKYWYLFVISTSIAFFIAKIYIRYAQPVYSVKSTLLIKDYKHKNTGIEGFIEGAELLSSTKNILNEIEIIRSYNIVQKTIQELDWEISYFVKGSIKEGELYRNSPFSVKLDTSEFQLRGVPFYFKVLSDSTYLIYMKESETAVENILFDKKSDNHTFEMIGTFGEKCTSDNFSFTIKKPSNLKPLLNKDLEYYFIINNLNGLTNQAIQKIKIQIVTPKSSVLELSSTGPVFQKEIDFLNKLSEVYIQTGLDEKNQMVINTINFIDDQLFHVSDSLKGAELELEKFRSSERFMNLNSVSEKAFQQMDELENVRAGLLVKDRYYRYVLDYIETNSDINKIVAPSSMGIDDPLLNKLITELYSLHTEQVSLGFSAKEKNPTYSILEMKIRDTKKVLIENLNNIIASSSIHLSENLERLEKVKSFINRLPNKERNLINIQRKFHLSDHIYNYLLQKRTEASIAKAANTPDNKIINSAKLHGMIFPNTDKINIIAILLGLVVPAALIFLKFYFNDTIAHKQSFEKRSKVPLIGVVGHFKGESATPITDAPKSQFSESVRSLRVNLQYLAVEKKNKIIGITSSISGEGKTFFALNLAASLAVSDSKTVIIGADLRKPKLNKNLNIDNGNGLSTYLINKASINEIISRTPVPNLDIITSGPVPPNPTELLETVKMKELIQTLSSQYEYIIIDAPPVGLVADYFVLSKFVDANLYMVRQNYTKIHMIQEINNIYHNKKLNNFFIVFNDARENGRYGYGYGGYGYGYSGYGYGYYEEKQEGRLKKLRNLFKKVI